MLSKTQAIAAGGFLTYIAKAADTDVISAISNNTTALTTLLNIIPVEKRDHAYAPGKWTIAELLQHMIDAERVFAYRALRTARIDATPMPGFDENKWADAAAKTKRPWNDLVTEFLAVRSASTLLFQGLGEAELLFAGTASGFPINALAMGYTIAGHVQHHIGIIEERYL
jgi:DinB superfamily